MPRLGLVLAIVGLSLWVTPINALAEEPYVAPYANAPHPPAHHHRRNDARSRACANAAKLENQYHNDKNTGHPAAANDLLSEMREAENRCHGK